MKEHLFLYKNTSQKQSGTRNTLQQPSGIDSIVFAYAETNH